LRSFFDHADRALSVYREGVMPLQAFEGLGSGNFCEFSAKDPFIVSLEGDR